jgi:hypothetical protein
MRNVVVVALLFLLAGCQIGYMSDPRGAKPAFTAALSAANETPPVQSAGYGVMEARYVPAYRTLEWKLYFGRLSGPVMYAFLQGPDGVGNERADLVPVNPPFEGNVQFGSTTLSEAQAADLMAGKWSVEIRTAEFPAGEIRGPLVRQP